MEFKLVKEAETHRLTLVALPGEYDARPILDQIQVSCVPLSLHPDRLAAAFCLLFGSYVSGAFQLPGDGCAPHVANAIEGFVAPTRAHAFPVNCVPSRVPTGDVGVRVIARSIRHAKEEAGSEALVRLCGMDEAVGMLASNGRLDLTTNVDLLSLDATSDLRRALPALGIAVLFCEDLLAGSVELPARLAANSDEQDAQLAERVRQLLDSVCLGIRWVD